MGDLTEVIDERSAARAEFALPDMPGAKGCIFEEQRGEVKTPPGAFRKPSPRRRRSSLSSSVRSPSRGRRSTGPPAT
eukprot:5554278-Alexandrium_andersonii.AAC.1